MQRKIIGFHPDEEDHWVAELDCGHGQHMRHTPPFFERPWTQTGEGRRSRLGTAVECVKCDQFEWPEGLTEFRRTPEYTGETMPEGLRKDHATTSGVWGKINVIEGEMIYRPEIGGPVRLDSSRSGIVVPEMRHSLEKTGEVRFVVVFYRLPVD